MTPTCGRFGGKTATGKLIRGLIGIPRRDSSRVPLRRRVCVDSTTGGV